MAFVDPYIDKNTGLLRNLIRAVTPEDFEEREAQIVFANQLELEAMDIPRSNNFYEVLAIHGQLFKGVYDWAGKIRTVDIKKNEASRLAAEDMDLSALQAMFDRVVRPL